VLSHIQLMKTALGSLQRLRRQLDDVVRTRLPGWIDEGQAEPPASTELKAEAPSEELLEQRRREAARIIELCAGCMAANAFNPVPVLDVGIDVGILTGMTEAVAAVYGLDQEQTRTLQAQARADGVLTSQQVAERAAPYLAERVFGALLPRLGLDLVTRESAKWLPLFGSFIAARIGYRMTQHLGEKVRAECEAAAQ
jgi:uncharacterized protein (DUF697 family)